VRGLIIWLLDPVDFQGWPGPLALPQAACRRIDFIEYETGLARTFARAELLHRFQRLS
jgi:hypothetical protein